MNNDLLWKFLKFGVVGFSGVFVDFGVTWVCREKVRLNQYIANSTGFLCAVLSNYALNRVWTFHSTDPAMATQFSKFLLASLVGLGINNGIIYLLTERYKVNFYTDRSTALDAVEDGLNQRDSVNFYVAKLCATVVVTLWNFWANYTFTFKG